MTKLTVNTKEEVRMLHNFWNHIHFHPTDAIEDAWGQRILDRVCADHAAETVRMYTMMEDIVTMSPAGELQYDFTENDVRMDYMVSKGFRLLLCYNFIPACIARDTDATSSQSKNSTRYKGKMIVASAPKDYALWEEICRTYTAHIVERYGLERVSGWYLQCFNEPDCAAYFLKNERDTEVRCREYCKLYDAFEQGIRSVSDKLCMGGCAVAGNIEFWEYFLKHVKETGKRLDFLSYHTYGTTPGMINSGALPISASNSLEIIRSYNALAEKYGFGSVPVLIDEWGASSHGFYNREECPGLIFRENEIFSAFYVKMVSLYEKLKLPIDRMMICLSGQHEMKEDFSGFRGFFTLNFYPKPIYNAYVLAAKLGESKIACEEPENENLTVLASRSRDGRIAVLLSYSSEHFDEELPDLAVNLSFAGLSGEQEARLWYIDRDHANAYRAYERLGSPDDPTPEQVEEIRKEGTLSSETCRFEGELPVVMQNNGVLLVETALHIGETVKNA